MTINDKFQKKLRQRAQAAYLSGDSLNQLSDLSDSQLRLASKAMVEMELEDGFLQSLSESANAKAEETTKPIIPLQELREDFNFYEALGLDTEDTQKLDSLPRRRRMQRQSKPITGAAPDPGLPAKDVGDDCFTDEEIRAFEDVIWNEGWTYPEDME